MMNTCKSNNPLEIVSCIYKTSTLLIGVYIMCTITSNTIVKYTQHYKQFCSNDIQTNEVDCFIICSEFYMKTCFFSHDSLKCRLIQSSCLINVDFLAHVQEDNVYKKMPFFCLETRIFIVSFCDFYV